MACEAVKKHPKPIARVLSFEDSFVMYDVRVWVSDYGKHPDHRDEVLTRVWEHLRWAGISFAFPQRNVHLYDKEERNEQKSLAVSELLEQIDLFTSLQTEEKDLLASQLEQRRVRAGQRIVEQGAEGQSLYVIAEGLLEVRVRFEEDGTEHKVAQVGPGDFFGEMSLLTGAPRSASVLTMTDVIVYKIEKIHIESILKARPPIAENARRTLERATGSHPGACQYAECDSRRRHYASRLCGADALVGSGVSSTPLGFDRNVL